MCLRLFNTFINIRLKPKVDKELTGRFELSSVLALYDDSHCWIAVSEKRSGGCVNQSGTKTESVDTRKDYGRSSKK